MGSLDGKMNDGGERVTFGENTAQREPATGKGRPGLISPFALTRLSKWYELGAKKYSDRNWEKGMPFSRYTDSMFRHLIAWEKGDETEDHLSAIIWNAMAIVHHQERGETQFDDMPHYLREEIPQEVIDRIKSTTDLCDTFSCYEDCQKCVKGYLKSKK